MKQKYTVKKKESNRRWDKNNIERITVAVPKGKKQIIKDYAEGHGESVSKFVNRVVDKEMSETKS